MKQEAKANSIRQALKKVALHHPLKWSVNDFRIILTLERIVARLESDSTLREKLIFKGGFVLLKVWRHTRFTRDLDALGQGIDRKEVQAIVPKILAKNLDDGFWFGDVKVEELDHTGEYGALRFNSAYQIGEPPADKNKWTKLSRIHFDVGFGDPVTSNLDLLPMASILPSSPSVSWRVYPPEFIFSEKLEALVKRGSANSRAKDVMDLLFLLNQPLNPETLKTAIHQTFEHRKTPFPTSFAEFLYKLDTKVFEAAWNSLKEKSAAKDFESVWSELKERLQFLDS